MNAVVFALAFQSKAPFLAKPGGIGGSEAAEELGDDAYAEEGFEEEEAGDGDGGDEDEEGEGEEEEEARNAALYPELLASFFGEDHKPRGKLRKKPKKQLPASKNASPNPKPRATSVTSSSFKPRPILNPNPSSRASPQPFRHHHATNSNKINGIIKARAMSLSRVNAYGEAADLGAERAVPPNQHATSGSESDPGHIYGYGDDKNIDERADAFIDSFYSRMKAPQVDPYLERLERSRRR
jgi:hypothetical protein